MERRDLLRGAVCGGIASLVAGPLAEPEMLAQPEVAPFELEELTIAELQSGMQSGRFTARSLAESYLTRISEIDRRGPALRSVLETNPDALAIADALDRERREKGPRGPLHGIPVLVKDNLDTADRMTTTAGSFALEGSIPVQDSTVAKKLRALSADTRLNS